MFWSKKVHLFIPLPTRFQFNQLTPGDSPKLYNDLQKKTHETVYKNFFYCHAKPEGEKASLLFGAPSTLLHENSLL